MGTAEKGRLSEEDIERMVREAEEYADEDKKVKERIDARNGLESYLYNMKNTLDDEEKGVADKLSAADKEEIENTINEALDWLDENPEADKDESPPSRRRSRPSPTPSCGTCTRARAAPAAARRRRTTTSEMMNYSSCAPFPHVKTISR